MLTHDMNLVDAYAEKVAVLHEGRLVYAGAVAPLWSRPADLLRWGFEWPSVRCRGFERKGRDGCGIRLALPHG